jgi:hypothetical protein
MSVRLMSQVWELELSHSQLLVALALADHGDDAGSSIYPSIARIAWKSGYSPRQARRIVRELESRRLLVKVGEPRGTRPTEYRMDVSACTAKPPFDPARADTMSGRSDCPGGHSERARADILTTKGGHSCVPLTVIEPSVEPSIQAEPSALHPEARPKAAPAKKPITDEDLETVFEHWRIRCRNGSPNIRFTRSRKNAVVGRLHYDNFTVADLKQAIDGAAAAIQAEELDYEHHWTELYKICVDSEHVNAWIEYEQTGDYYPLSEAYILEEARVAA